ncbi:TPA: hypothetical protein WJG57_000524 [Neisseria meningitidis]
MAFSFRRGLTVGIRKKTLYPCNRVCIMKPMKLRLHLNFENRHNLLCNPFEHSGIKAGGFYILKYSGLTKIRTRRRSRRQYK